eukprot:gene13327-9161_t
MTDASSSTALPYADPEPGLYDMIQARWLVAQEAAAAEPPAAAAEPPAAAPRPAAVKRTRCDAAAGCRGKALRAEGLLTQWLWAEAVVEAVEAGPTAAAEEVEVQLQRLQRVQSRLRDLRWLADGLRGARLAEQRRHCGQLNDLLTRLRYGEKKLQLLKEAVAAQRQGAAADDISTPTLQHVIHPYHTEGEGEEAGRSHAPSPSPPSPPLCSLMRAMPASSFIIIVYSCVSVLLLLSCSRFASGLSSSALPLRCSQVRARATYRPPSPSHHRRCAPLFHALAFHGPRTCTMPVPTQTRTFTNERGEDFFLHVTVPPTAPTLPEAAQAAVPVLLCVHGAGMSGENFYRLAEQMSCCVAMPQPEGVASTGIVGDYTHPPRHPFSAPAPTPAPAPAFPLPLSPPAPAPAQGPVAKPPLPLPPRPARNELRPSPLPSPAPAPVAPGPVAGEQQGDDLADVLVATVSYDLRCHGRSTFAGGEASLTLQVLVEDFVAVLQHVALVLFPSSLVFVLGHSLGAAIVARGCSAPLPPALGGRVSGVVLLDAVEGTAKLSVQHMGEFLRRRPTAFASPSQAVDWFLHSGGMRTPEGAALSVPPLLRPGPDGALEWRSDLAAMAAVWGGWFDGLDQNFLAIPLPKMLCVASVDRLDKALTVGHMQGKFQLEVCGNHSGHYIQDDVPGSLAIKLRRFVRRTQDTNRWEDAASLTTHTSFSPLPPLTCIRQGTQPSYVTDSRRCAHHSLLHSLASPFPPHPLRPTKFISRLISSMFFYSYKLLGLAADAPTEGLSGALHPVVPSSCLVFWYYLFIYLFTLFYFPIYSVGSFCLTFPYSLPQESSNIMRGAHQVFRIHKKEACNGLWRSEDMLCMNIIAQRDVLRHTISGIGRIGKAQFLDMNEGMVAFSRPFTEDIRLCDELLRKLRLLEDELEHEPGVEDMAALDVRMSCSPDEMRQASDGLELDLIADHVEDALTNLQAMLSNLRSFRHELNHNQEVQLLYSVLSNTDGLGESVSASSMASLSASTMYTSGLAYTEALRRLPNVVGTIKSSHSEDLRRLCYRVTRGNAVLMVSEEHLFLDAETGERTVSRCLFALFASSRVMVERLGKLIDSLGATIHSLDDVLDRGEELQHRTRGDNGQPGVDPLTEAMERISHQKAELLLQWYGEHRVYKTYVRVERAVLQTMNMCSISGQTATIVLWIPTKYIPALESVLEAAVIASAGDVPSVMTLHVSQRHPPTFFETDWFTSCFQSIVDSYGMARYKEVNPGVFTIVTFPYLFGMMYGDMGHGLLLLCISLYFIYKGRHWREDKLNEMVQMIFGGRYLLLFMSLYAIYMGVLYNDFMGFSLNLFPSGYKWGPLTLPEGHEKEILVPEYPDGLPNIKPKHTYAVGLDVAWAETENKLEFYNSVKMKCAVIVGVVQMFVGLFLSLSNYLYHKQWVRIYYLFIPEFVFLLCTFGYMSVLIIIKWCTQWENTHLAPSLLEVMTNFFLQPGSVTEPLFDGQALLQTVLLLIAFAMVPIMLCAMPVHDYRRYKAWLKRKQEHTLVGAVTMVSATGESMPHVPSRLTSMETGTVPNSDSWAEFHSDAAAEEDEEFEDFDLSELIIHYVIHTIEYVLSTVSNTASYLRLWALSLAHAQLSEVFFNFAVVKLLETDTTGIAIGIGVLVWVAVTLAVLVGMEALSSFLHALRLHWVEFQNKFYLGDGKAFEPFDLRNCIQPPPPHLLTNLFFFIIVFSSGSFPFLSMTGLERLLILGTCMRVGPTRALYENNNNNNRTPYVNFLLNVLFPPKIQIIKYISIIIAFLAAVTTIPSTLQHRVLYSSSSRYILKTVYHIISRTSYLVYQKPFIPSYLIRKGETAVRAKAQPIQTSRIPVFLFHYHLFLFRVADPAFQLSAFGESAPGDEADEGASSVSSPPVAAAHLMTSMTDVPGMTVEALLCAHTQSLVMLAADHHFQLPAEAAAHTNASASAEVVLPSLTLGKSHIIMDGVEAANVTEGVPDSDYYGALQSFSFGAHWQKRRLVLEPGFASRLLHGRPNQLELAGSLIRWPGGACAGNQLRATLLHQECTNNSRLEVPSHISKYINIDLVYIELCSALYCLSRDYIILSEYLSVNISIYVMLNYIYIYIYIYIYTYRDRPTLPSTSSIRAADAAVPKALCSDEPLPRMISVFVSLHLLSWCRVRPALFPAGFSLFLCPSPDLSPTTTREEWAYFYCILKLGDFDGSSFLLELLVYVYVCHYLLKHHLICFFPFHSPFYLLFSDGGHLNAHMDTIQRTGAERYCCDLEGPIHCARQSLLFFSFLSFRADTAVVGHVGFIRPALQCEINSATHTPGESMRSRRCSVWVHAPPYSNRSPFRIHTGSLGLLPTVLRYQQFSPSPSLPPPLMMDRALESVLVATAIKILKRGYQRCDEGPANTSERRWRTRGGGGANNAVPAIAESKDRHTLFTLGAGASHAICTTTNKRNAVFFGMPRECFSSDD